MRCPFTPNSLTHLHKLSHDLPFWQLLGMCGIFLPHNSRCKGRDRFSEKIPMGVHCASRRPRAHTQRYPERGHGGLFGPFFLFRAHKGKLRWGLFDSSYAGSCVPCYKDRGPWYPTLVLRVGGGEMCDDNVGLRVPQRIPH